MRYEPTWTEPPGLSWKECFWLSLVAIALTTLILVLDGCAEIPVELRHFPIIHFTGENK